MSTLLLTNCKFVLLNELSIPEIKPKNIAKTYALAILSNEVVDFEIIDKAIVKRWDKKTLNRIKDISEKHIDKWCKEHRYA